MTNGGQYRGPVPAVKDPCQSEEDEYQKRVAEQKATQRELNRVNSPQAEKEIMSSKDEKRIADWKSSVKKATEANNKAVEKVNEAFRKLEKCRNAHPHDFSGKQCWCGARGVHGGQPR